MSGNLFSLLEARNKNLRAALQTLLGNVRLHLYVTQAATKCSLYSVDVQQN